MLLTTIIEVKAVEDRGSLWFRKQEGAHTLANEIAYSERWNEGASHSHCKINGIECRLIKVASRGGIVSLI